MADTVTSQTITDVTGSKTVMKFTNFSDGTGESLVTKVDAIALNHASDSTKIARVIYSINTTDPKGSVEILFDGTTNASALFLSGQGTIDSGNEGGYGGTGGEGPSAVGSSGMLGGGV